MTAVSLVNILKYKRNVKVVAIYESGLFLVCIHVIRRPCWCSKQKRNVVRVLHNNRARNNIQTSDVSASFEIIFYLTFRMLLHTSSEVTVNTKLEYTGSTVSPLFYSECRIALFDE